MNNELLLVIGRTILVLFILFILTKLMGKKQISQINLYDYIVGITIGSIAADISLDIEKDTLAGVVALLIYGLSSVLVTKLTMKCLPIRRILTGIPTILMENGNILSDNMCKEGIDINDLQEEARQNNIFDLSKVNNAILETSGKISFQLKINDTPLTKKDMKIKVKEEGLVSNLIIDGTIIETTLKNINKDKTWLQEKLKEYGHNNYQDIILMTIDSKNKITIYKKNNYSKYQPLE